MKSVLLIGAGLFGKHIAEELNDSGHEIMAVDIDEEKINSVIDLVLNAQIGNACNPAFLSSLDIPSFDVCIVTIGEDFQASLETTSLLKELGARHVISRASNETHKKFLLRNGADEVVYPEKQLAAWTAIKCTSLNIIDYIPLPGEYAIYEIHAPAEWANRSIGELDVRKKYKINILAIKKNGVLNPEITSATVIDYSDSLLVLGTEHTVNKCFHL